MMSRRGTTSATAASSTQTCWAHVTARKGREQQLLGKGQRVKGVRDLTAACLPLHCCAGWAVAGGCSRQTPAAPAKQFLSNGGRGAAVHTAMVRLESR